MEENKMDSITTNTPASTVSTEATQPVQQAQPDKSARFKEKAENQTSKVMTEIESHGENSAEEEIQEGQENLGGTGSRGFRRRKRNKQASIFNYTLTPNCLLTN